MDALSSQASAAGYHAVLLAASGYAKEVGDETQRRHQAALAGFVADADVVITTAQIPGRPAPMLISREMVERMRPSSVIVDVAAAGGGNCELTHPGENIVHQGVLVMGPTDLAARVAVDASQMYARNLSAFVERITDDEANLTFDFGDEIVAGACVTHDGSVVHPVTRRALESS